MENVAVEVCEERHLCGSLKCSNQTDASSPRAMYSTNCFCDVVCQLYGDCCFDFRAACPHLEEIDTGEDAAVGNVSSDTVDLRRLVGRLQNTDPPACVYPTIFGRKAYFYSLWMIQTCAVSWPNDAVRAKCLHDDDIPSSEEGGNIFEMLMYVPATELSGITFRNIYCALCNGLPPHQLHNWNVSGFCPENITEYLEEGTPTNEMMADCSLTLQEPKHHKYPLGIPFRTCIYKMVVGCNVTQTVLEYTNETLLEDLSVACGKYQAVMMNASLVLEIPIVTTASKMMERPPILWHLRISSLSLTPFTFLSLILWTS